MEIEELSTKELKELLDGLTTLSCFVIKESKNGISASDAFELVKEYMFDSDFRASLNNAVEGMDKLPAEVKDLSAEELADIGKEFLEKHLPKILAAIKG